MKQLFILLSISLTLTMVMANEYQLKLTQKELNYIQNSSKKHFIIKRFKQYQQLTKKIRHYSTFRKLSHVNTFFNRILPKHDTQKYGISDYWTTQKEFLIKGNGDCEDYAISKYFTLLEVGIPKEQLFLAIVQVKGKTTNHMVLLYVDDKNRTPLVMDNLNLKVLPLSKRKKLVQKVAFNEYETFLLKDNHLADKAKINWKGENKWETILHRVYTLRE